MFISTMRSRAMALDTVTPPIRTSAMAGLKTVWFSRCPAHMRMAECLFISITMIKTKPTEDGGIFTQLMKIMSIKGGHWTEWVSMLFNNKDKAQSLYINTTASKMMVKDTI